MLRPSNISAANLPVALKPLLGKEKKLFISLLPAIEVGSATVTAEDSLTQDLSNAGAIQLDDRPSYLLGKLEEATVAESAMDFGVIGTDEADAVISGALRFSNPSYAQEQGYTFPAGTSREVLVAGVSRRFKTVTTIVPMNLAAEALGAKVTLFGIPDLTTFKLVGCRVTLNYTPEARQPLSVACGGDDSAYVKPGQKPVREVSVTVKLPSLSDGLARYNGIPNLVLLAKSDKEERVVTDHEYLIGAQLQGGHNNPEASEPSTLEATGQYEDYAHIPAGAYV